MVERAASMDSSRVDDALGLARESLRRLKRRRRLVASSSLALLALVALRGATALVTNADESRTALAVILYGATALALLGVGLGYRWGRRAEQLRAEIASLELTRDVLDHHAAPYVYVGPYRAPARTDRSAAPEGWRRPIEDRPGLGLGTLAVVATVCVTFGLLEESATGHRVHFNFLEDSTPGALGFTTPVEAAGEWALEDHQHATGGRALVNRVGAEGARPAVAVIDAFSARHLRADTRCKFMPEHPERACGLVFRYRDPANYHVARLDVGGVTLVAVVSGLETTVAHARADVSAGVWHDLGVVTETEGVTVSWNGRELLTVRDARLPDEGAVGLWAPANAHVWFDQLAIEVGTGPVKTAPVGKLRLLGS